MACKDKRKVWVQVKTTQRKVFKCFEKQKTKHYNMIDIGTGGAKPKTYSRKKKITKPLNLADFTIPGYRRKKKKTKKARRRIDKIPLTLPPRKPYRKPHRKPLSVEPTFDDDAVDDIVLLRKAKTCAARKYASTNAGHW